MPADVLLAAWLERANTALEQALPQSGPSPRLASAMRHAALGGGKRLRPLLAYASGHVFGADDASLDAAAVSVELIHAFSLVHDDLPAMDDDALRRGLPTVHVAFDEATAILAGDALQALAFSVLADAPLAAEVRLALVRELAGASGAAGMCAGQSLDMSATGQQLDESRLRQLQALKTGALIRAAVRMGAISAGASPADLERLDGFSDALGLAFQIRDDLLDLEADSGQLGKTAGKDQAQGKSTYPSVLGLSGSRDQLGLLAERMREALEPLGSGADPLRKLAGFAISRLS